MSTSHASTPDRHASWRRLLFLALGLAPLVFSIDEVRANSFWTDLTRPTREDLNKMSFLDAEHGWIAGDNGTILRTDDGAKTWTVQSVPLVSDIIDIDMANSQVGWALADEGAAGSKILKTVNGGVSWSVQSVFAEDLRTLEFFDATVGCVGGEQGKLWRTGDGGATWVPSVIDDPETAMWPVLSITFYSQTLALATGGQYDVTGLVWRTTDGGKRWTHTRVAGEPMFATYFLDEFNVICVGGDLDWGTGMAKGTTAGTQWDYRFLDIWGQASAVSFRTANEGWAPLGFAGTYMYTLDRGNNWTAIPTPTGVAMNDVVFTDEETGYMVGGEGTILQYVSAPTGVDAPTTASVDRMLLDGGANPFRGRTDLQFRVQNPGVVTLKVYDSSGRDVATLVKDDLAPGTYTKTFDGAKHAEGVYYFRIAQGSHIETRKMTLVK